VLAEEFWPQRGGARAEERGWDRVNVADEGLLAWRRKGLRQPTVGSTRQELKACLPLVTYSSKTRSAILAIRLASPAFTQ